MEHFDAKTKETQASVICFFVCLLLFSGRHSGIVELLENWKMMLSGCDQGYASAISKHTLTLKVM